MKIALNIRELFDKYCNTTKNGSIKLNQVQVKTLKVNKKKNI